MHARPLATFSVALNSECGILGSVETAKMLRAAWQPVFHTESLSSYAPTMQLGAKALLARLERAAKEVKEVNIWRLMGDMTMDVVGTTAFGWAHPLRPALGRPCFAAHRMPLSRLIFITPSVDLKTQSDDSLLGSGNDPTKSFTAAARVIFEYFPPMSPMRKFSVSVRC